MALAGAFNNRKPNFNNTLKHQILTYFQFYVIITRFVQKLSPLAKHKIVLTGGPSTGKTTLINELERLGNKCLYEISRTIILEAQQEGIEQLFLEDPLLFSQRLLDGRIDQFNEAIAHPTEAVFIDRGIPDILAYMEYANSQCPDDFAMACNTYQYDQVFVLPPWEKIHITDNERYESFEQAQKIHQCLVATYTQLGYNCITVPFGTVSERSQFILETIKT